MTAEDFRWVINDRLLAYLPDLSRYVGTLSDKTKTAWAEQFSDVERTDLVEACRQIVRGDAQINRYEYEQLASKLLTMCRAISEPRYRKEQSQQTMALGRQPRGASLGEAIATRLHEWGIGPAFRELMSRVKAGEDYDTVRDAICGAIKRGER